MSRIYTWNYDMSEAPRQAGKFCVVAVVNSRKVRWCLWNLRERRWIGLLKGEVPLAFQVIEHPGQGGTALPKGMGL